MLAQINSGTTLGLKAVPIQVEVDVASRGLPSLSIVGLPDKAVQESKERVRAALENSGTDFPTKRITINLAPADIPKIGPAFDLPMALGILLAKGDFTLNIQNAVVFGELSLDGSLRPTTGALPLTLMAKAHGFSEVYLPQENAEEAAVVEGIKIFPVDSIKAIIAHLTRVKPISPEKSKDILSLITTHRPEIDMADIHGQEQAKRVMEIAAAGAHNVFLKGVPGAGKTMLSRAFAGILPRLTPSEALEVTKIYSITGSLDPKQSLVTTRPFRSPHHTTSRVGLIGGGSIPTPGEISLAHRGVLFLDEFPEFPRSVLESLRQPLEDGRVNISRAKLSTTYPSRFILVAAANPCPCGNLGSEKHRCTCSAHQINNYQKKISGPILDRIDLHLSVSAVKVEKLTQKNNGAETSAQIQKRVQVARNMQYQRFKGLSVVSNGEMSTRQAKQFCKLGSKEISFLAKATSKLGLTARSYFKTLKTARTIADLEKSDDIQISHLAEALQYRPKRE